MKKNFSSAIVAVAAISGIVGYFKQYQQSKLSVLAIANIEAITKDEMNGYLQRDEKTISIRDDKTGTYESITIIDCKGKGDIVCP